MKIDGENLFVSLKFQKKLQKETNNQIKKLKRYRKEFNSQRKHGNLTQGKVSKDYLSPRRLMKFLKKC